jgi:hypothetical protein
MHQKNVRWPRAPHKKKHPDLEDQIRQIRECSGSLTKAAQLCGHITVFITYIRNNLLRIR